MIGEVRLGKCFTWGGLALCDTELTPAAKLVCLAIEKFTSPMGDMVWPGKETLAQITGLDMPRLEKALDLCRKRGYLKYARYVENAIYHPAFPTESHKLPAGWDVPVDPEGRLTIHVTDERKAEVLKALYGAEAPEVAAYEILVSEKRSKV